MNRWDPSRFAVPGLALLSAVVLGFLLLFIFQSRRTYAVVIAAGSRNGESYVLANALKTVAERHYKQLTITVLETHGTSENLTMLETRQAHFATAQADIQAGPSARLVAILFRDAFQLLVRKDSRVNRFADLAGQRVALPSGGGQQRSFQYVAEYFGLPHGRFQFVEDDESGSLFMAGKADALFRVRALGNPALNKLVRDGNLRLVPIDQVAAMRIMTPAFEPDQVPRGAYLGTPPLPENDIPTIFVQRTLLAHADLPPDPVMWITATLIERREEMAQSIPNEFSEMRPLLASIHQPDATSHLGSATHPGALYHYEKDKPSFVQSNADFVALILSFLVLSGSWLWELRRWLQRTQKNNADAFRTQIVGLINQARVAESAKELSAIREELMRILSVSVVDLDEDRINEQSFQSMRAVWEIALDAVRERLSILERPADLTR